MSPDCVTHMRKVALVTSLLQRKWSLHILCAMRHGPVRLSQLTRLIPKASKKALRAGLRDLESARVIIRRDLSGNVLHVEYDFTGDMRPAICRLLDHLAQLGEAVETQVVVS